MAISVNAYIASLSAEVAEVLAVAELAKVS